MEIARWIDQKLSQRHGNHQGLSYGQLSVLLIYIITQADHRLCAVEEWVNRHRQTLELTTGWSIGEKDATDDRLARVVEELGQQEEACQQIELKLGQHLIRAYQLPTEVGRAVTTTAQTLTQTRYLGRGRPAANAPQQQITRVQLQLEFQRQSPAIEQAEQLVGWRSLVTS